MIKYRGNSSKVLVSKFEQRTVVQNSFRYKKTTKACLLSLKTPFEPELRSRVLYKRTYCRCYSTYVGQTVRPLITRIEEQCKEDIPVGQHLQECGADGIRLEVKSEFID